MIVASIGVKFASEIELITSASTGISSEPKMIRNPYDIYGEKRFPLDDDVYCSLSYSDVNPNPTAVDYIPASLLSSISGGAGPATSGGNRHYIDPWDLENFAYLQR